jgi:hypothetical protein
MVLFQAKEVAHAFALPWPFAWRCAMAYSCNWQEQGTWIAGVFHDEESAKLLVKELKRRIKDPKILNEIDNFMKEAKPLSEETRDLLHLVCTGIMMQLYKSKVIWVLLPTV